ncbi:HAD-IB family hydrolase [Halomonas sediminis]
MHFALFDLDDTLLNGDCSALWNTWMVKQGWVEDVGYFLSSTRAMQVAYHAGRLKLEEYLALTLSPLTGRSLEEVQEEVDRFVISDVVPLVFHQARERIESHRQEGDELLLISASARHLVEPVARHLGIAHVIAVELAISEGRYTGVTSGQLSYRGGKVSRLKAWLAERRLHPRSLTFYSDSRNDLPLLNHVDRPVAVNPDPVLAEVARVEGWPHLNWRAPPAHADTEELNAYTEQGLSTFSSAERPYLIEATALKLGFAG